MLPLALHRRLFLQGTLGSALTIGSSRLTCAAARHGRESQKSVIFLWMNGGPSHIDMWDPKPSAPSGIRSPFAPIATAQPGIQVTEHLPGHAKLLDRLTLLRSIDCSDCEHDPNTVMQTGNREARKANPRAHRIPAIGSVVSRFRGPNQPGLPSYVTFHVTEGSIARGGALGRQHDPFHGNLGAGPFRRTDRLTNAVLNRRRRLLGQLDRYTPGPDLDGSIESISRLRDEAIEVLLSGRAGKAFDLDAEPESVRRRYNRVPWIDQFGRTGKMNDQVLQARRLVEHGVPFVTVVLSGYGNSATWDIHGNPIKTAYGGVETGLKPLLAPFDHLLSTLVEDLQERGLLEDTLVVAVGEFGRSPRINKNTGRDHWPAVGGGVLAGGGLAHGQTVGATDRQGGSITSQRLSPADIAATIYRHLDIAPETTYVDAAGRPRFILESGRPIDDL